MSVAGAVPVVLENFKILGSAAAGTNGSPAVTVQIVRGAERHPDQQHGGRGARAERERPAPTSPPRPRAAARTAETAGVNQSCPSSNGGGGANGMDDVGSYSECVWTCGDTGCSGGSGSPGSGSNWATGGGRDSVRDVLPAHDAE